MVKVLGLIQGETVPASRYRILQYAPFWAEQGIQLQAHPHPEDRAAKQKVLNLAGQHDLIVIQRKRPSWWWLKTLKKSGKPIIYDVDDAVMFRDALSSSPHSWSRRSAFHRTVKAVDQVVVGNSFLKEQCPPNSAPITVIPTALDLSRYPGQRRLPDQPTMVWIGDSGSLSYLERHRDLIEGLGKAIPGLTFKVICDRFPKFEHVKVETVQWSAETEAQDLQHATFGIMPIGDDLWSQGKCALKLLQYMASGLPSIAGPAGMNQDLVQDGVNGYLRRHDHLSAWVEAAQAIVNNPDQGEKIGREARLSVEKSFSLRKCSERWAMVFAQALAG